MQRLIESLKILEEIISKDERLYSASYHGYDGRMKVLVDPECFYDILEEHNVQPFEVEVEPNANSELNNYVWTEIQGIMFHAYMNEPTYQRTLEPFLESDEVTDEEFLTGVGPDNEARMREAGHKLEDFG